MQHLDAEYDGDFFCNDVFSVFWGTAEQQKKKRVSEAAGLKEVFIKLESPGCLWIRNALLISLD